MLKLCQTVCKSDEKIIIVFAYSDLFFGTEDAGKKSHAQLNLSSGTFFPFPFDFVSRKQRLPLYPKK